MVDRSPAVSLPRLKTPRLLLREYRMSDFEPFAEHLSDPVAGTFTGVHDRRNAWRIFGCNMGEWLLKGAGWWGLEVKETGAFIGMVGAFFRDGWPEIEMGWNLLRAHWRRGLATEAAAEVMRYAFEVRGEKRVTALIDAKNTPSLKVAAHLGLVFESDTSLFGTPVGRYVRARDGA